MNSLIYKDGLVLILGRCRDGLVLFLGRCKDGLLLILGRCWYSLVEALGRRNRWSGFGVPRETLVQFGFCTRET